MGRAEAKAKAAAAKAAKAEAKAKALAEKEAAKKAKVDEKAKAATEKQDAKKRQMSLVQLVLPKKMKTAVGDKEEPTPLGSKSSPSAPAVIREVDYTRLAEMLDAWQNESAWQLNWDVEASRAKRHSAFMEYCRTIDPHQAEAEGSPQSKLHPQRTLTLTAQTFMSADFDPADELHKFLLFLNTEKPQEEHNAFLETQAFPNAPCAEPDEDLASEAIRSKASAERLEIADFRKQSSQGEASPDQGQE